MVWQSPCISQALLHLLLLVFSHRIPACMLIRSPFAPCGKYAATARATIGLPFRQSKQHPLLNDPIHSAPSESTVAMLSDIPV